MGQRSQFVDRHALAVNINRLRGKIEDETHKYISNVYGWDINGLADMEHNNRFICGGTYNDTEKLSDKKRSRTICGKVEDTLEAIITGRGWKAEEELEDSLWGRTERSWRKQNLYFGKKKKIASGKKK